MLWLTENTLAMMCFAPLTGKKDVDVWLLTLEASDFIHSWTCQTECIQAITDECVNRPVVHPSKVTPWQLYDVWDCSLCHPQWFASFAAFFFFSVRVTESQPAVFTSLWSEVWQVSGLLIYLFSGIVVLFGNSLLVLTGADLLIQLLIFFPWQLPDSTVTQIACWQQHKQTLYSSTAFRMHTLMSHPVRPCVLASCFEGEALKCSYHWVFINTIS